MTKDEIIANLQTDANFALNFAVDNNLLGVNQALTYAGYTGVGSRSFAYTTLDTLFKSGQTQKVIDILTNVRYMNNVDNYTGGLADFFLRNSPPTSYPIQDPNERLDFNGVLAALGSGLSTYASVSTANSAQTAAVVSITQTEIDKAKKEEEAAAKKKKTIMIVSIVGGSILLVAILVFVFRANKEKK